MTKIAQFIRLAHNRGYRVTDDGTLLGFKGSPIKLIYRKNHRYPTFSIYVGKEYSKDGYWQIPAHRFAAYCFYGEELFNHAMVRHINDDVTDISKKNIALGSNSDNQLDRTPEARSESLLKAWETRRNT